MKRGRVVGSVGALLAVGAVAVLFVMNPRTVAVGATDQSELLADQSFEQPLTESGVWRPKPADAASSGGFSIVSDGTAHADATFGRLAPGDLSQEVLVAPIVGRAYRFSVWVRQSAGANGAATGSVRAQTACASNEEAASTPFTATKAWTQVTATVQPVDGQRCSLRVGISVASGSVDVDSAEFHDAGLVNPSFELGDGKESWALDVGATASVESTGADDGAKALNLSATKAGAGIRQDVPVDPSSQPLLAVAAADVRSVSGSASVSIEYREPCSTTVHRTTATVGTSWQTIRVAQPRLPGETQPPSLIRPDGKGCVGQVAIVAASPGSFVVDGAALSLASYWPPDGDPSYQRVDPAKAKKRLASASTSG